MKTIHFFPLEPLEERYTTQWRTWFLDEFAKRRLQVATYEPKALTEGVSTGSFLDVFSTWHTKAHQVADFSKVAMNGGVQDGDVVFLLDLWFPVEALAYIRDGAGIDFKICGIMHAGTYDPWDFLAKKNMASWGEHHERTVGQAVDLVFSGTEYHANLLREKRGFQRVVTTGLPVKVPKLLKGESSRKKDQIVFPHRLAHEKQPGRFRRVVEFVKEHWPDWSCVMTKDLWDPQDPTGSKARYYETLASSKIAVSLALQETFGIAMLEAAALGCTCIVPDRLSYQETFKNHSRFISDFGLEQLLIAVIERNMKTGPVPYNPYENAEKVIVDHIEELLQW